MEYFYKYNTAISFGETTWNVTINHIHKKLSSVGNVETKHTYKFYSYYRNDWKENTFV